MPGYPTNRPKYFAQKVIRKMVKSCAASELGQTAFMLVAIVATTEDAAGYTRPVTFFNDALLPLIGVRKWDTLDRARKAAVDAGWLEYEAPVSGKRTPGRYWVKIPAYLDAINDGPVDEETTKAYPLNGDALNKAYPINGDDHTKAYPVNGDAPAKAYPVNGDDPRKAYTLNGYASEKAYPMNGDGMGDAMGEPSSYTYTKKERESACSSESEEKKPDKSETSKQKSKRNSKQSKPDFDPLAAELPFQSDRFRDAWSVWVQHRAENKSWTPLKPAMVRTQLKQMAEMGEVRAVAMIEHTVGRGWCGLREPDGFNGKASAPDEKPRMATDEELIELGYKVVR